MKYLVLLAVVCGVLWWLRLQRPSTMRSHGASRATDTPQPMVACDHCGVHLPRHEALTGARGTYCCAEHRARHET